MKREGERREEGEEPRHKRNSHNNTNKWPIKIVMCSQSHSQLNEVEQHLIFHLTGKVLKCDNIQWLRT